MAYAGRSRRTRGANRFTDAPTAAGRRDRADTGAAARADADRAAADRAPAGHDTGEHDAGAHDAGSRARPRGRPFAAQPDWRRAGAIGTGLAIGALLGAGVALLLAPQSGRATRRAITRAGVRARTRAVDAWADLGDEWAYRRNRTARRLRRRLDRGRWDAQAFRERLAGESRVG